MYHFVKLIISLNQQILVDSISDHFWVVVFFITADGTTELTPGDEFVIETEYLEDEISPNSNHTPKSNKKKRCCMICRETEKRKIIYGLRMHLLGL